MRDVVIVSGTRTAVGRFVGMFEDVPAIKLGAITIEEVVKRAGVSPDVIDWVIMGAARVRILTHLLYELKGRGGGLVVAALCGVGSQGEAVVIKV